MPRIRLAFALPVVMLLSVPALAQGVPSRPGPVQAVPAPVLRITGAGEYSAEQLDHGGAAVSALEYLGTSRFWFESLQNWQSEFLAVGALIVLSIFLRQRGSPESKPVAAPHAQTGD